MMDIMEYAVGGCRDMTAEGMLGIFGHPIGHTLSPVIHNTLSDALGVSERYIPFHVEYNLGECVACAFRQGILGLNITVPHKQEVMQYLVDVDAAAATIGAVNTLVRTEGGYKGYNTDMPGLARAIESEGISLRDRRIVMLGAGGAARAVAYMCLSYGAEHVYILNRTFANAKDIADDMNRAFDCERITPLSADAYRQVPQDRYLFIQCTSVGLHSGDGLPLVQDAEFYGMADYGVDLIYNPAETPFLKLLKKQGAGTMNGLKMLLYQGIMAYELWNDVTVSEELTECVYRRLERTVYGSKGESNIILIGYMGAGKTSVGRCIAEKLGYKFVDTDVCIEEEAGMSVSDIFAKRGEGYFRELETAYLKKMLKDKEKNRVISTGGGLPMRAENRELLRELGSVYYLRANADTIYERVKDDASRPLLRGDELYKKISDMLAERNQRYILAADAEVSTDGRTPEELAEEMIGGE